MSINPTAEVEESLRLSCEPAMSPARDHSASTSSSSHRGIEQEMATQNAESEEEPPRQGSRDTMDLTLPENDGMKALRQKMHEIRTLAISTEEKAKRMHRLMTQDYLAHRADTTTSPLSMDSGNNNSNGKNVVDEEPAALDVGLAALPIDPNNPYSLRPGDADPSFSPLPPNPRDEEDLESSMELEMPNLGCRHYKRNVKVQCFDCHRWFPCRHCHDAATDLPFAHNLRRKMTKNMLCMLCRTPQPAAEVCVECGEYAAYYFCGKCKLWDNDSNKRIYHCDDCGICRVGEGLGKDFVHCKRCNVCISISTSAAHPCVEGATSRDCPLCLDDLFESRQKAVSMPCGHYMHGECYQELMRVTYKCPVCSKSAVNMELQWRKLDDEIRAQPMPEDEEELGGLLPPDVRERDREEGAAEGERNRSTSPLPTRRPRTVYVGCNDCGRRSWTPFHWLGVKCQHCDSYNTNQMAPPAGHETEAERLIRQQGVHRQHDFTGEGVLRDAGIQPTDQQSGGGGDGRADSALDVPGTPGLLAVPGSPTSPGSPSSTGLPSPRRYFVDEDDDAAGPASPSTFATAWRRRPSFTTAARGFSTPSLPHLPDLPRLPRMPNLPNLPPIPDWAPRPSVPDWPRGQFPSMPSVSVPGREYWPSMMTMPHLELPTGGWMESLGRGLSPMRYYLSGMENLGEAGDGVGVGGGRERLRGESVVSVRSDPTADATAEKREGLAPGVEFSDEEEDEDGFWGARARRLFGRGSDNDEEDEGPRGRGGVAVESEDEEEDDGDEEESESESSSEDENARVVGELDDDDDDDDDEEDELDLVGQSLRWRH